eukprot:TRINITY_DN80979_c0_g1_i1.p1 TRINITY_DN80979_c0_g1~~TRINITY_DN80979_c0_g1_i1.p1  ORF type:complete len:492 (-),score=104.44 TRINITY_DN80979_c0_g1_i1:49-1461(-)
MEASPRRFPPPPRPPPGAEKWSTRAKTRSDAVTQSRPESPWRKLIAWTLLGLFTALLVPVLVRRSRQQHVWRSVAQSRELLRGNPRQAIALLHDVAATAGNLDLQIQAMLLDGLGDAHYFARQFAAAEHQHSLALNALLQDGADSSFLVESYQRLAADVQFENSSKALGYLQKAHQLLQLPKETQASLLMSEAKVYECASDFDSALQRMGQAAMLLPGLVEQSGYQQAVAANLARLIAESPGLSGHVQMSLRQQLQGLQANLLERGPWERKEQMPLHFTPGLEAKPWHTWHGWPNSTAWLQKGAALLKAAGDMLRAEYDELRDTGMLRRQTECIGSPGADWRFFEINAPWEELAEDGCSAAAPAACRLWRELHAVGMPLERAGYSVVEARGHLRMHMGRTNEQLKWHFGLYVPEEPAGCARIRVAEEHRVYARDEFLFFDDSFEHEVWNNCNSERVVFQLVFRHPGLPAG